MLKSIEIMFDALDKEGIDYCHWKSNEHLEEALNGETDLDILFSSSSRSRLDKVLNQCNMKRFRAVPGMQYNAIEDYIGYDQETASIWHLHLHYKLTLGEKHLKGYVLPFTNKILNNRVIDEQLGVYRSESSDELFLMLLRMALKLRWRDFGRKIGTDDILELNWLSERTNKDEVVEKACLYLDESCAKEYGRLLEKKLIYKKQLSGLQRRLRRTLKVYASYSRPVSLIKRLQREAFWIIGGAGRRLGISLNRPYRRVSPSGGTAVAFLGCDGAGKSTTLSYVKKELKKKLDVQAVYLGSGDGSSSIFRYPMRLIARKVGGKGLGKEMSRSKEEQDRPGLKKRIKRQFYFLAKIIWAVTLASEKKGKLKRITRLRNRGIIVLLDRYPQTNIMGCSDGPLLDRYRTSKSFLLRKISNWEYKVYKLGALNPPDLIIKLVVKPEIAVSRKPEMTIEEIEKKIEAVQSIDFNTRIETINTEGDFSATASRVLSCIWDEL